MCWILVSQSVSWSFSLNLRGCFWWRGGARAPSKPYFSTPGAHITYWALISMWGSQPVSEALTTARLSVGIWGPRYLCGRSICEAISMILWSPWRVDGQWICGTFFSLWNPLWICRVFGMLCLLVIIRGPGDLDGRRIYGALISTQGPQSVCGALSMAWLFVVVGSQSGSFSPDSLTFFLNLGPLPKNSGPNPMSFQFLTRGTWGPQKVRTPPWGNPRYATGPNQVQILSFASMASREVAIKHSFVNKIAGGCSSYDVIAPWPGLTSSIFYQKLRKVCLIRYPKTRRRYSQ